MRVEAAKRRKESLCWLHCFMSADASRPAAERRRPPGTGYLHRRAEMHEAHL